MIVKKKITYKDWDEIGKYNYAAKWLRRLCTYTLKKEPDGRFKREQRINLIVYIIIFIPIHVLQAIALVFDGGLKNFGIEGRYLGGDWFVQGTECFNRADKVWNRKS